MPRVNHGVASRKRRKKVMKLAKGQRGGRSKLFRTAKESVKRALAYSYRDRRTKKRLIRRLWITRINAACKERGINYSQFIKGLKAANIAIDRKILSALAQGDVLAFDAVMKLAKAAI